MCSNLVRAYEDKKLAEDYLKYRSKHPPFIPEVIMKHLVGFNPRIGKDEKFNRMLDVGCGSGRSTHIFASYFKSILGIDISAEQIRVATANNVNRNVDFQLVHDNLLPVDDGSVDLIVSGIASHFLDMEVFVPESERALKPNGCVALFSDHFRQIVTQGGVTYGDKFRKLLIQFLKDCKAFEATLISFGGQQIVFDKICNPTKRWLQCPNAESECTLKGFLNDMSTTGEYREYMKNENHKEDPLRVLADNLKSLIKEEKSRDEDVKFTLTVEYPIICFKKQ